MIAFEKHRGGLTSYRIALEGIVQGVGFRPFVRRLADRFGLPGIAFNTAGGLIVEVGTNNIDEISSFVEALKAEAPVAARIERCEVKELSQPLQYDGFQIVASAPRDKSFTLISTDLATCEACRAEMRDPCDRRFGYAFTNCTNCGPRYSITLSTPYDRVNTTMNRFEMCAGCAREYADSGDRRFHAEPIACPVCGPQLSKDVAEVRAALVRGCIVAIKGLGGFQLACDAICADAVERLRTRKRRSRKPFALMMRDMETVRRFCSVSGPEERVLLSAAAPIVLLSMLNPKALPSAVAPGLHEIGVMLPYTPLHHLLFDDSLRCLVMTSGNISEEPIVIRNEEAAEKLGALADERLTHDRDIFMRVDDSVVRIFEDSPRVLRRARGFAPEAISLAEDNGDILACGGELKNTFCLTKARFAILSQHIGDLENFETLQFFEETLRNLQSVYQATPRLIAHDLHPDYLSTRWAQTRPEPKIAVQHHHAHIASCMAENALNERVIGVAFDGTGFGSDGQIWGGEFLVCDFVGFDRVAHFRYVPLPGGDRAAREPWRMAAAHLFDALGPGCRALDLPCWAHVSPTTWRVLERLIQQPALFTSSCGRLFDAVASICGISQESSYEGESAMLLEARTAGQENGGRYGFELEAGGAPWIIDTRKMVAQIAYDIVAGRSPQAVSLCFHNSIAHMIEVICSRVRERNGLDKVCLSGGTFQNLMLLTRTVESLRRSGFQVFLHAKVPPNDGGLSLGQAVIAANFLPKDSLDVSRHTG
jgi:hydrogenase maturation protein HypF